MASWGRAELPRAQRGLSAPSIDREHEAEARRPVVVGLGEVEGGNGVVYEAKVCTDQSMYFQIDGRAVAEARWTRQSHVCSEASSRSSCAVRARR